MSQFHADASRLTSVNPSPRVLEPSTSLERIMCSLESLNGIDDKPGSVAGAEVKLESPTSVPDIAEIPDIPDAVLYRLGIVSRMVLPFSMPGLDNCL